MGKRIVGAIMLVGLTLSACGGGTEDTSPDTGAAASGTSVADESPPADPVGAASDPTTTASTAPAAEDPPAEETGTVTWGAETYDLTGDDFLLCETVNPAFAGNFNIQTALGDTEFSLMGNIDDYSADHQGLRLGFPPEEDKATDLELNLDGRNLSGRGETSQGPIEFSFDC